jgi:hypothetical protein
LFVKFDRERKPDDAGSHNDRIPTLHAYILAGAPHLAFFEMWVLRPDLNLKRN